MIVVWGIALPLTAQRPTDATTQWSAASRRRAEDTVAARIESMRSAAGLSKLRRVRPSEADLQLVCTAAKTGKGVHDPAYGGLYTYVTGDLSAETERLRLVALGTSQGDKAGSRYEVYSDRNWPRYSVIVDLDRNSTPERPLYTVGVARRRSGLMEFWGPLSFDHPRKDANDWKEQVDPGCRSPRP